LKTEWKIAKVNIVFPGSLSPHERGRNSSSVKIYITGNYIIPKSKYMPSFKIMQMFLKIHTAIYIERQILMVLLVHLFSKTGEKQ
jgi:hypothetical protein